MLFQTWMLLLAPACGLAGVLDPAPFLAPGPPLAPALGDPPAGLLWQAPPRYERDTELLPSRNRNEDTEANSSDSDLTPQETFWAGYRAATYNTFGAPVAFGQSGFYGKTGFSSPGLGHLSLEFGRNPNSGSGSYKSMGFAGSGYGSYGRIFGGQSGPSWSGWGNGKWGHYGRG